jgi:hypothetical protein
VGDIPQRVLQATISLSSSANGLSGQQTTYAGSSGSNVATLSNLRMSAKIVHAGAQLASEMDLSIFGVTKSLMQQLSTLGVQQTLVPRNPITLLAGNAGGPMTTVFTGQILTAVPDYNQAPNVPLIIKATATLTPSVSTATPTSFSGGTSVVTIMQNLAKAMNLQFENNGISAMVSAPYYAGSYLNQMYKCAEEAGINAVVLPPGVLAIWPKGGSRTSITQTTTIAPPPTGQMIGYPAPTANGVMLRNVFDPTIVYGQKISVQSSILQTATYSILGLSHDLECLTPKGKWESTIQAFNPNLPVPIL